MEQMEIYDLGLKDAKGKIPDNAMIGLLRNITGLKDEELFVMVS